MAEPSKDTIYIDVDDEITAIIDKLRDSDSKLVALVLPKRASVLQSVVNMKLLKRTADETKKNVVLITSEAGLLPLAGAVGMYVAKTLTSRPEIPTAPVADDAEESVEEDLDMEDEEPVTAASAGAKSVGELAGAGAAAAAAKPVDDAIETVELDDDDLDAAGAAAAATEAAPKAKKPKKDKKLAVPSFDRFRLFLILGALVLIILIVLGYVALAVLPKASIQVKTDAQNVNTSVNLTLDTGASSLDADKGTVPAKQVTEQKTYTGSATTTGKQNNGQKATGTITITNCDNGDVTIPAGTGFTSSGGTYISQQTVFVPDSDFSSPGTGSKCKNDGKASVQIEAQTGGSAENVSSGTSFSVDSGSGYHASSLSAVGSASGGTDDITQVVAQADIDSATSKITTDDSGVKSDLESQLQGQNLYPIEATYTAGTPAATDSAAVGAAANSVTVTEVITYTMMGAAQNDLKTLVDNDIKSQINTNQQGILNEGITQSAFKVNSTTATTAAVSLQTTAEVGPNIDVDAIKQAAAGRKSGDIQSNIKSDPDVTDVSVHLSPFWVTVAPKKTSKITVTVAKPTTTAQTNGD